MERHEQDQTIRVYMSEEVWRRRQSRGEFLRRSGLGLAGLIGGPALLAACGGSGGGEAGGGGGGGGETIRMINYIDWMGKKEVANFKNETGISVQQIVINPDEARIAKLAADRNSADMLLLDPSDAGRLRELELLAKLDLSKIPNYQKVDEFAKIDPFTPDAPYGIPSDYGRDGFVYRTDIVTEAPTSWKEFFELCPKYSGKVTILDFESDSMSCALKALGHSANTKDEAEIKAAGDLLTSVKPHISALVTTDMLKPLLDGSGAMGMDWDYDAGLIIAQNPDVPLKWVDATDGMRAYLDAWSAVSTTKVLDQVQQFMNFHLDPKNYAEFVNTLRISVLVNEARPFVDEEIKSSEILFPPKDVQDRIEFSLPRGEAQKLWDDAWASFKSA